MEYEINNDTQLIMPIGKNSSKIIESSDEYFVKKSALSIMEHSCEYFGSSFEGRKEGTKKLLGITHKSPLIIEESRQIIFFPTTSPDNIDCIWVNLNKISDYYQSGEKKSKIVFKNGEEYELDLSIGSLTNQILRATRLKFVLDERLNIKEDNN